MISYNNVHRQLSRQNEIAEAQPLLHHNVARVFQLFLKQTFRKHPAIPSTHQLATLYPTAPLYNIIIIYDTI